MMDKKTKTITYCGLDVELNELKNGLKHLRNKLRELKAPTGTIIKYNHNGPRTLSVWKI